MVYNLVKPVGRSENDCSDAVTPITELITRDSKLLRDECGPYSGGGLALRCTTVHLAFGCSLLSFIVSSAAAIGLGFGYYMAVASASSMQTAEARAMASELKSLDSSTCYSDMLNETASYGHADDPYQYITGTTAHKLPKMYGRVIEKTIWLFRHDREHCPSSARCKMPAYMQLCLDTIRRHKGSFDIRILHSDTVDQYVSMTELPLHWSALDPRQQRDGLMHALLARYGGVALDISTILFRPFDEFWDAMVSAGATFRGYMYRLNGQPWGLPESSATWFLMSRREGLFSTVVRDQRTGMCRAYRYGSLDLGDQTLTPVLGMFNYSLPRCSEDPAVAYPAACPEHSQPDWSRGLTGPARNDRRLLLQDPRDGPQLPFSRADELGLATWRASDAAKLNADVERFSQAPLDMVNSDLAECDSMKSCWEVFLHRLHSTTPFVRIFDTGGKLRQTSLKTLLSDNDSYFYRWLRLAGASDTELAL